MGKEKIVLDTNVLVSALGWNGKPKKVFNKIMNKEFDLIISKEQLDELKKVLNYPKFEFTNDQKLRFLNIVSEISYIVDIKNRLKVVKEDPDDDIIIETALENNANIIISGDEHLLKLKKFKNIKIMTCSEFLEKKVINLKILLKDI